MKKNGLLTFIFACVPGAGQMYYGYMQRGLSLITLFCLSFGLGTILEPLMILAPIIWMYSFFDTYDMIRHLVAGDARPDSLLFLGDERTDNLFAMLPNHNKLIGWLMVGLGGWALYSNVLAPFIEDILRAIGIDDAWYLMQRMLPSVVVAVLLIVGGFYLVGGGRFRHHGQGQNQPPYQEEAAPYPFTNQYGDPVNNPPEDMPGDLNQPVDPMAGQNPDPHQDGTDSSGN